MCVNLCILQFISFSSYIYLIFLLFALKQIALQWNNNLRQQFKAEISVFDPDQLVFPCETDIVHISCHIVLGKTCMGFDFSVE